MQDDPIVEEVRKVRDAYAAKFNYDLEAIFLMCRSLRGGSASLPASSMRLLEGVRRRKARVPRSGRCAPGLHRGARCLGARALCLSGSGLSLND